MEVITRGDVACVPLLWQRGQGWVFTFVCKAIFELKPGEAALANDPDPPSDVDIAGDPPFSRSLLGINDLVPLKPRIDVFVTGHAHAPGGVPVRSLRARLAIGTVDKTIEIVADRYFDREGRLVEGAPFSRMPLAYELAAGGPGTWNPAGLAVGTLDGLGHLALPNLVPAGLPPPTPDAPFVPPIGLGPLPADWPSRAQKLGRRSLRDLPPHWHGAELTDDFPRDYFNAAPEDQQLAAMPEDLTMTLENLVPGHPLLTCWLPSITPSILCEGALGTSAIRPSIDTIHIHTDTALCSVVWRGHLPRRDASDDMRVLVSLENPRVRVRAALGATGEHPRVPAPPPSRAEPPTFSGTTGEHPRVPLPPLPAPPPPRAEPPTFSGTTGEHPRVLPPSLPRTEPPTFSGTTGEHPRVVPPPLPPSARPTPRPALPTAPLLDSDLETDDFNPYTTQPIPNRKSEPTRLFTPPETPRVLPPERKSSPTALYPLGEPPRAIPSDRKSSPTALYPLGEPPRALERTSEPGAAPESAPIAGESPPQLVGTLPADIASLTEIEADPEPAWESDSFDEEEHNPRDTIAPGLISPVGLPFPVPAARPTPDSDWGSSSLTKTGMYPWGAGTEPGRNAPPIPDARPSAPASVVVPPPPVSRPAQSGHTLPPAPLPGVDTALPAEMRAPPMSAALRAEMSVPALRPDTPVPALRADVPVVASAPIAESASPGETPWGTGPSGPRRETIGMAWTTGAVALAEPRYDPGFVDEPTPAPEPARSPSLLLWFDADSVVRIRRAPQWKALLDELEKVPLDRDLESEGSAREPWELEDRRDVMEICARGHATNGKGCEESLSGARTRTGKIVPPIVLVEGELEMQLDELETLKAAATTVAAHVAPPDEGLRSALEATDTFLRRQGLSAAPAVCEGLLLRLREAFTREKKALPADYLDRQIERALLTGRHYQRRDVFGGPYFRAFLRVPGEKEVLVTYLPEAVHRRVPMHRRFAARVIADIHPTQDPYETRPLALRALALSRTT